MDDTGELKPLPSVEELNQLSIEITVITQELNEARLEGFLKEALNERSEN